MRTNKLTLMKPVVEINIDAELIEDRIVPLNKSGKLNVIKCLFSNLRSLANSLHYTRCDVAGAIQAILSGDAINLSKLGMRYSMAFFDAKNIVCGSSPYDGHVMVTYDSSTGELTLCGYDSVILRSEDVDVVDRIPHDIPIDYNDYTETQLLTIINHLFVNIRALATTMENARPDITIALDSIATEYSNPTVGMTIHDIGGTHRFDIRWNHDNENTPYIVFDRRDNHIYLYRMSMHTRDMDIPDDHLKLNTSKAILMGSAPAVRPSVKLLDKYKKNPSKHIMEKLYVRGEPIRLGDPRFSAAAIWNSIARAAATA